MKAWVLSGIFLAGLSTAAALRADTVILENGDRISGHVLGLEAGNLLFESAYGGQIKLPWAKVLRLESDAKVRVQLDDGSLLG